jgi:hypothetical protein
MTDVVAGFEHMVWRIQGFDGQKQVHEERVPIEEMSAAAVGEHLEALAGEGLTAEEASALEVSVDAEHERMTITCGDNPHFVASLWRRDELEAE